MEKQNNGLTGEPTLIIIDGNSLIHRAFYALPAMNTHDGIPTNAVYGFFSMLFSLVSQYEPAYLGVAFDMKGGTFRHKEFPEYKAGRKKTPEELSTQIPLLKETLERIGVATFEKKSFEADDILGTIAGAAEQSGVFSLLVTGDRDSLQLISEKTNVLLTRRGVSDTERYDAHHLLEVWGVSPEQITDMKGLMGDSSDNIPGVAGVGEKTAAKLLGQYQTIDALYERIEELPKNKLKEKLVNGEESAFLSKRLATIKRDVPLEAPLERMRFSGFINEALQEELSRLQFGSLLKRMGMTGAKPEKRQARPVMLSDAEALNQKACELAKSGDAVVVNIAKDRLCIAACAEEYYYIDISADFFGEGALYDDALRSLAPLKDTDVILHDAKLFMHELSRLGIAFSRIIFDTALADYVENPSARDHSLEKLALKYEVSEDAAGIFYIYLKQKEELSQTGLDKIYYDIELPLVNVLFSMEKEGFTIDKAALYELSLKYASRLEELALEIYDRAGEKFNILSPKQLGVILFEKLGLPAQKKTKTGYSTDIEVLEGLAELNPIISPIIEYRQYQKLKSTYIDGLTAAAGGAGSKVHTTFKQMVTATGRISSTEPNLQNIPVRSELSSEIRRAFIPEKPGNVILSADYSQIELRVLAHISQDKTMLKAFSLEEDIHRETAAQVFGVSPGEVTKEMRSSAKAVNFGIVYGISDFGLGRSLGIPRFMARDYIDRYLERFSGVREYMKRIVEEAKASGSVRTLMGRIRYIPEIKAANAVTRALGERIALNTPIQGTAADIIKRAMIDVYMGLKDGGYKSRLILQVHDELILECVPEELSQVSRLVKSAMENAFTMDAPLKVNIAYGSNWGEAK